MKFTSLSISMERLLAMTVATVASALATSSNGASRIQLETTFNSSSNYGYPSLETPIISTVTFDFELDAHQDSTNNDGSRTTRVFGSGLNSVQVDTDIFDKMLQPHIDWTNQKNGNAFIVRDNNTGKYQFNIFASLGYTSEPWHYFKSVFASSTFVSAAGYSPFDSPGKFLTDLKLGAALFETSASQDRWQRVNRRDYYEGGNLSGTAVLSNVPEPSEYLLLIFGLTAITIYKRLLYRNMFQILSQPESTERVRPAS